MTPRSRMARRWSGFALAWVALATACSATTAPPDRAPIDAAVDTAPLPTHAYTYVIDQLTIDLDDSLDNPHTGFDLDGLFSSASDANGCNHADYFAALDRDQNCPQLGANGACAAIPNPGCAAFGRGCVGGVDNQLPTLLQRQDPEARSSFDQELASAVTESRLVLLIRVSGITDPADREQAAGVTVNLYLGYPTFSEQCHAVTANRRYSVSRASLIAGAADVDQAASSFAGSIRAGRLMVASDASGRFTLPVPPIRGSSMPLRMRAIHLRADITASGLEQGALGGWEPGNDIVDDVAAIAPDYANVVRNALGTLVDIQLDGICDDSTTGTRRFGALSLGFGLHAVPAVIDPTTPIADTQAPGTCGYVAYADAGPGPG